jgi:hypothetical protein
MRGKLFCGMVGITNTLSAQACSWDIESKMLYE